MDRLICGDVGFGKTEVGMRAIYRAVANGRQVAFLAPTTVLAAQHLVRPTAARTIDQQTQTGPPYYSRRLRLELSTSRPAHPAARRTRLSPVGPLRGTARAP